MNLDTGPVMVIMQKLPVPENKSTGHIRIVCILTPGIFQMNNFNHTYDSRGLIAIIMSYWVIIRHECNHNVAFLEIKLSRNTVLSPG